MESVIDRLLNLTEWNFGGDERREIDREAAAIRETLNQKLDPECKKTLENLCDAFMKSSNCEVKDAFIQGFYNGIDLMTEYGRWRGCHDWNIADRRDS